MDQCLPASGSISILPFALAGPYLLFRVFGFAVSLLWLLLPVGPATTLLLGLCFFVGHLQEDSYVFGI